MLTGKDVTKALTQPVNRFLGGVTRDWTGSTVSQGPQVVDPVTVIGVIMGPENGIKPANPA